MTTTITTTTDSEAAAVWERLTKRERRDLVDAVAADAAARACPRPCEARFATKLAAPLAAHGLMSATSGLWALTDLAFRAVDASRRR